MNCEHVIILNKHNLFVLGFRQQIISWTNDNIQFKWWENNHVMAYGCHFPGNFLYMVPNSSSCTHQHFWTTYILLTFHQIKKTKQKKLKSKKCQKLGRIYLCSTNNRTRSASLEKIVGPWKLSSNLIQVPVETA